MEKECKIHGLTDHVIRKDKHGGFRCKKCAVIAVLKRRKKLKQSAIEYKGGECEKCGYNKSISALEFHHVDPTEKDFTISSKTNSWGRIKKEIDKCILVCANCHREIHDEMNRV